MYFEKMLQLNLDQIIKRAKKGLPTYVVVWGATRSGKSTLAMQSCQYISDKLKTPWGVDHVFFDSGELMEKARGKQNHVFLLDEAAFNMMGVDWQNEQQKNMIKYMMTAAKYAPVIFICIPRLEKISANIIEDEHARGLEVYLSKNLKSRGFTAYTRTNMVKKWYLLRDRRFGRAMQVPGSFRGVFGKDTGVIDMEQYDIKKDNAIESIGKKNNKNTDKKKWIMNALNMGLKQREVAKIFNLSRSWIKDIKAEMAVAE